MSSLPLELLIEAFRYLSAKDIVTFRLVCKKWRNLIESSSRLAFQIERKINGDPSLLQRLGQATSFLPLDTIVQELRRHETAWQNVATSVAPVRSMDLPRHVRPLGASIHDNALYQEVAVNFGPRLTHQLRLDIDSGRMEHWEPVFAGLDTHWIPQHESLIVLERNDIVLLRQYGSRRGRQAGGSTYVHSFERFVPKKSTHRRKIACVSGYQVAIECHDGDEHRMIVMDWWRGMVCYSMDLTDPRLVPSTFQLLPENHLAIVRIADINDSERCLGSIDIYSTAPDPADSADTRGTPRLVSRFCLPDRDPAIDAFRVCAIPNADHRSWEPVPNGHGRSIFVLGMNWTPTSDSDSSSKALLVTHLDVLLSPSSHNIFPLSSSTPLSRTFAWESWATEKACLIPRMELSAYPAACFGERLVCHSEDEDESPALEMFDFRQLRLQYDRQDYLQRISVGPNPVGPGEVQAPWPRLSPSVQRAYEIRTPNMDLLTAALFQPSSMDEETRELVLRSSSGTATGTPCRRSFYYLQLFSRPVHEDQPIAKILMDENHLAILCEVPVHNDDADDLDLFRYHWHVYNT